MRDEKRLDVDRLTAIDVHVHIEHEGEDTSTDEAARKYFGEGAPRGRKKLAEYYRSRNIGCVVFPVDERLSGRPQVSNDSVLEFAAENADIMMAFASIDPHRGAEGVREAKRLIATRAGPRTQISSAHAAILPQRPHRLSALRSVRRGELPVLFHTGHSGIGTNMPGGGGVRLKYGNPMHIDDVAVDFPDLPIIMAHPSFPWQDEAISICLHKPTVYIDLSGWSPKYFPPTLIQYANTLLKTKVLFGSDYPLITPDRWMADFAKIAIKDEVRPLILKENAAKLFGLASKAA